MYTVRDCLGLIVIPRSRLSPATTVPGLHLPSPVSVGFLMISPAGVDLPRSRKDDEISILLWSTIAMVWEFFSLVVIIVMGVGRTTLFIKKSVLITGNPLQSGYRRRDLGHSLSLSKNTAFWGTGKQGGGASFPWEFQTSWDCLSLPYISPSCLITWTPVRIVLRAAINIS